MRALPGGRPDADEGAAVAYEVEISGEDDALAAERTRLMCKVAHMYHRRGLRQSTIAATLHISQPRVSRLLKRATDLGLVRVMLITPGGIHTDLEEQIERRYGLQEVLVVDSPDQRQESIDAAIGRATAGYLEASLTGRDTIGVSSWGPPLAAAVEALPATRVDVADRVVQLVGGVGAPSVQSRANRLLTRLASQTGAMPLFVPAPGLLDEASTLEAIRDDPALIEVFEAWGQLSLAVVAIGTVQAEDLARHGGRPLPPDDRQMLTERGAVGHVCLRFQDADGQLVTTPLDDRVMGIAPATLLAVPRRVGIGGGNDRYQAIRAAIVGGWITVLITDLELARRLATAPGPPDSPQPV